MSDSPRNTELQKIIDDLQAFARDAGITTTPLALASSTDDKIREIEKWTGEKGSRFVSLSLGMIAPYEADVFWAEDDNPAATVELQQLPDDRRMVSGFRADTFGELVAQIHRATVGQ